MTTDRSGAMDEARRAAGGGASDRLLEMLTDRIGARSGVQAAFGEPIEHGEVTVVPVARVRWFFGAGAGSGPVKGAEEGALSVGSGGGGWAVDDPVGYLEIRSSGAGFRPVSVPYPSPVFLLASGVAAALVLRALARVVRG
jgi:hypothetical protein